MATGLQVWSPSGALMIDTSTSVVLMLGTFAVGGQGTPQSGSIYDARLSNGRPFYFMLLGGIPGVDNNEVNVTFSGDTLTWSYPKPDGSAGNIRPNATIMYGTY